MRRKLKDDRVFDRFYRCHHLILQIHEQLATMVGHGQRQFSFSVLQGALSAQATDDREYLNSLFDDASLRMSDGRYWSLVDYGRNRMFCLNDINRLLEEVGRQLWYDAHTYNRHQDTSPQPLSESEINRTLSKAWHDVTGQVWKI